MSLLVSPDMSSNSTKRNVALGSILRWTVCVALIVVASCQLPGGDVTKLAAQDANFADWLRNTTRGVALDSPPSPNVPNVTLLTSLDETIEHWTCSITDKTFKFDKKAAAACQQELLDSTCITCRVILGITVNLRSGFGFIPDDFLSRAQKLPCLQKIEVKGSLAAGILASKILPDTLGPSTLCFDVRGTLFDPTSTCEGNALITSENCPSGVKVSLPPDVTSISIRGQPRTESWSKTKLSFAFPRLPRGLINLQLEGTAFGGRLPTIARTIESIEIVKNQFSGSLPLSWTQGRKATELELWEPRMTEALEAHIDVLGQLSSLQRVGLCFEEFEAGGERKAQKRIISSSSQGSVSKMCGLAVEADRKSIELCSVEFDRVAYCSLPEEQNFMKWSEGLEIYENMTFTLHDDPHITEKILLCKTLPKEVKEELRYDGKGINRCDRGILEECPECSRIAGISLALNGVLSKEVDVQEFLKEIGDLPCLQKLEVKGDFAEEVLLSPLLKTTTQPTTLCFDVRDTFLEASSGCKTTKSCSKASEIALSNTTEILSIIGSPSSQAWSRLPRNSTLFPLPESLLHLHIEGTMFGGNLPDSLPSKVKTIDIARNQFSGFLPWNWTLNENLVELRVWEAGMADDIKGHVEVFEGLPGLEKIGLCVKDEKEIKRKAVVKDLVSDALPVLCDLDRDFVQICSTTFERIANCGGPQEKRFMEWAKSVDIFEKLELTLDGDEIVESPTKRQCSTFPDRTDAFYDEALQNRCKAEENFDCPDCKRIVGVTVDVINDDGTLGGIDAEVFLRKIMKLPCLQTLEVKGGGFAKSVLTSSALQEAVILDTLCLDLGETFTNFITRVPCRRPTSCFASPDIVLPDTLRKLSIRGIPSTKDWKRVDRKSTSPLFPLPKSLQQLHLEGTTFGGVLPSTLPDGLTHAVLTKNQFSGEMPSGWGKTVGLTQLHVWEPGMEKELSPSVEILTKLPEIEGIGLCFDDSELESGGVISNSFSEVSAICSLKFRLHPEDFQICSAKFDRVLYCSGPQEASFWKYSQSADIYQHLSLTMHDERNIGRNWMACSTFPNDFRVRFDRDRLEQCQSRTEASCPWCSRILAIDLTGEIEDPGEKLDIEKFVEEIGELPCLQKLELRGEFGRRVLTTPLTKSLSNLVVICTDAQDTPLDPSTTTPQKNHTRQEELILPSKLRTLSIRGSQPLHEWRRVNTTFPLFKLPKSLKDLHLEGTSYGGLLPKRLPRSLTKVLLTKNQFTGLLPGGVVDGLEFGDLNIWEPGMENRLPLSFARARLGGLDFRRRPSLSLCFQETLENGVGNLFANSPKASVAVLCDTGLQPKICFSKIDMLTDCREVFSDDGANFIAFLQKQMTEGHLESVSVGAISKTDEAVFTDVCQRGRCFRSFHSTNYTGEELSLCQQVFGFEASDCPRCKRIIDVSIGHVGGSFSQSEQLMQAMGSLPCLFRVTVTQNSTEGLKSSLLQLENIDTLRVKGTGQDTATNITFPELPSNLRRLFVTDTGYGGSLPHPLPKRLQKLEIQNNWFTGPLPPSLPRGLRTAIFLDNQFTGTVPHGWCSATRLRELSVSEAKMDPAPLPECIQLINLRLLNVCFKDPERRLPEALRLELCSAGGQYCWRTLRDCLDDYALEILLGVWIPFSLFALVIVPCLPLVFSKFMNRGGDKGSGEGWWLVEWQELIMKHWAFQWFTKGFLLVLLYLWDIGSDLYVIGVLWGTVAAYIMAALVALHFLLAFMFFGRKVWKAGLETRQIDASIKVPDKFFDWVFLHWAHRGNSFVRVMKVVLVSAPGTIAFDTFGIVSRLTGSRLEYISSKFDFYAHFESRALTESIVEAPLEAIFQSIVFGIGTNDTLNFGISRRTFLVSILAGMFSMTKALVLLRYRSWEYGVSFWVILYKEATGTMDSLDRHVSEEGCEESEGSDRRIIDHADSCEMGVLQSHADACSGGVQRPKAT